MRPENSPFFGEDVVDLHLVVTHQLACVGVKNLQGNAAIESFISILSCWCLT